MDITVQRHRHKLLAILLTESTTMYGFQSKYIKRTVNQYYPLLSFASVACTQHFFLMSLPVWFTYQYKKKSANVME